MMFGLISHNLFSRLRRNSTDCITYNVDAGDEEGGPGHGRVEHLVREKAVLTVEREALHNAPGQVLQRLRRETLQKQESFRISSGNASVVNEASVSAQCL